MKKIYSILTLLIFSAVLVGCSEDNENTTEPSLKVINANLDFDVNGGTGIIVPTNDPYRFPIITNHFYSIGTQASPIDLNSIH